MPNGISPKKLEGMGQYRLDDLQALNNAFGAARKGDYQGTAPDTSYRSAEHRHGCFAQGACPHRFSQAGHFSFKHQLASFRSYIPGGHTRSAGGYDQINIIFVRPFCQAVDDHTGFIGYDLITYDLVVGFTQHVLDRFAAGVFPLTMKTRCADCENA